VPSTSGTVYGGSADPAPGGTKIETIHVKIEADHGTADLLLNGLNGAALKAAALPGTPIR
jgi:hypothetical protein